MTVQIRGDCIGVKTDLLLINHEKKLKKSWRNFLFWQICRFFSSTHAGAKVQGLCWLLSSAFLGEFQAGLSARPFSGRRISSTCLASSFPRSPAFWRARQSPATWRTRPVRFLKVLFYLLVISAGTFMIFLPFVRDHLCDFVHVFHLRPRWLVHGGHDVAACQWRDCRHDTWTAKLGALLTALNLPRFRSCLWFFSNF